jgi:Zn-dependent protease with chaperone function
MNAQDKVNTILEWFTEEHFKHHPDWGLLIGTPAGDGWSAPYGSMVVLETQTAYVITNFGDLSPVTIPRGMIIMHSELTAHLSVRQMKAIILHEIGHLLFGMSELKADQYAVDCGYGYSLAQALTKLYPLLGADMEDYDPRYFGTPDTRVARIRKNAHAHLFRKEQS